MKPHIWFKRRWTGQDATGRCFDALPSANKREILLSDLANLLLLDGAYAGQEVESRSIGRMYGALLHSVKDVVTHETRVNALVESMLETYYGVSRVSRAHKLMRGVSCYNEKGYRNAEEAAFGIAVAKLDVVVISALDRLRTLLKPSPGGVGKQPRITFFVRVDDYGIDAIQSPVHSRGKGLFKAYAYQVSTKQVLAITDSTFATPIEAYLGVLSAAESSLPSDTVRLFRGAVGVSDGV